MGDEVKLLSDDEVRIHEQALSECTTTMYPIKADDARALCATVRAMRQEQLEGETCEFCDEPTNDASGNPLTFLVCGRCWNANAEKNREIITALREQLAQVTQDGRSYQSGLLLECGCLLRQDSPNTEPRIIAHCDKGEP